MRHIAILAVALALGIAVRISATDCLPTASANAERELPLQDRAHLLDLISRYSHTWDNKDAEAWTELFTDDAVSQMYLAGEFVAEARSNVERLAFANLRHNLFRRKGVQTRHLQTNTILTCSDESVYGETIFLVTWQYENEAVPRLVHSGVYRDEFVHTASGWKFVRREIRLDHE